VSPTMHVHAHPRAPLWQLPRAGRAAAAAPPGSAAARALARHMAAAASAPQACAP
jgi:hypothetical protein